jgi:RimJ/RimL family protein N-acetyltransferase
MIVEATASDFASLLRDEAPRNFRLDPDSAIAPPEVLRMLEKLASRIRPDFAPSAWMMVEDGVVVGLCSVTRIPAVGEIHIGYGVAPSRQGRGVAQRAIRDILAWAKLDPRVLVVSAETNVDNKPSQAVLRHNGFIEVGQRFDPEDGQLICWRVDAKAR